jgi:hypothetical protein
MEAARVDKVGTLSIQVSADLVLVPLRPVADRVGTGAA